MWQHKKNQGVLGYKLYILNISRVVFDMFFGKCMHMIAQNARVCKRFFLFLSNKLKSFWFCTIGLCKMMQIWGSEQPFVFDKFR